MIFAVKHTGLRDTWVCTTVTSCLGIDSYWHGRLPQVDTGLELAAGHLEQRLLI